MRYNISFAFEGLGHCYIEAETEALAKELFMTDQWRAEPVGISGEFTIEDITEATDE